MYLQPDIHLIMWNNRDGAFKEGGIEQKAVNYFCKNSFLDIWWGSQPSATSGGSRTKYSWTKENVGSIQNSYFRLFCKYLGWLILSYTEFILLELNDSHWFSVQNSNFNSAKK